MIDRSVLEKFLTSKGISPSAPDEEIKSMLLSANWITEDVDTAITVLRENKNTHEQRVDSLKHIFHTDDRLSPYLINSLLGIEVDVTDTKETATKNGFLVLSSLFTFIVLSTAFALTLFIGLMWYLDMGLFA